MEGGMVDIFCIITLKLFLLLKNWCFEYGGAPLLTPLLPARDKVATIVGNYGAH
jgi:hypothetical protein